MKMNVGKRMKKILNEKIKGFLLFFLIIFISVFVVCSFQDGVNSLQIAVYVTSFFAIFYIVVLLSFGLFNYLGQKGLQFNRLSKVDFIGDKEMYRDILVNYSPLMLAYLDKMEYNYDILIVSGLLSLVNRGFIEFKNDMINVIKFDFYNLPLPERYIIENIYDGMVMINKNDSQFYKMILEECMRKKVLVSNKNWLYIFKDKLGKFGLFILIFVFGYVVLNRNYLDIIKFIDEVVSIIFFFGWIYICFYAVNYQNNPYSRSKIGEDLNRKLEGLRNYLEEYSSLYDRKGQEIVLWDDYLIYSVIFNQNKKIVSEYRKYYRDI